MLELFVDDEVVDVPPIEPVSQSYKYQVLQTVGGRGLDLDQLRFFSSKLRRVKSVPIKRIYLDEKP